MQVAADHGGSAADADAWRDDYEAGKTPLEAWVDEWGEAWTCYWSSMSGSLIDFIIRNNNGYLISNLSTKSLGAKSIAYKRFNSRLDTIREALIKYFS